jgi:hypothetical protein
LPRLRLRNVVVGSATASQSVAGQAGQSRDVGARGDGKGGRRSGVQLEVFEVKAGRHGLNFGLVGVATASEAGLNVETVQKGGKEELLRGRKARKSKY